MTKLKINIDKSDPPLRVIRKYKNYNRFMDTYYRLHTQKGIREMWLYDKKKMAYIAVIIALILIWIFYEDLHEPPSQQPAKEPIESVK